MAFNIATIKPQDFQWDNQPLPAPPDTLSDCGESDLKLTSWCIAQILDSKHDAADNLINKHQTIQRLAIRKVVWAEGVASLATFNFNRPERVMAITRYIFQPAYEAQVHDANTKEEDCATCNRLTSGGPMETCLAFGPRTCSGACMNCVYSGKQSKCNSNTKLREHEKSSGRKFTDEYFNNMSLPDANILRRIIEREQERRAERLVEALNGPRKT